MMPKVEQIYQHRHGGLYIVDSVATHTSSKERLVIYTHLYPFDVQTWARPIEEWTEERFREISTQEYRELIEKDRIQFQTEIGLAKGSMR